MAKRKADVSEKTATASPTATKKKRITTSGPPKIHDATMPASYTPQQKQAIAEFTSVTQGDKSSAVKVLKQYAWNVGAAVNAYFNNPGNASSSPARSSLNRIFDGYREDPKESPDEINFEGTGNLLNALSIELEDVGSLVFFELVQSPNLGRITREGFLEGLENANLDSLPKIRNYVLGRRSQLASDSKLFKNIYNHTFTLNIESERTKSVPLEQAEGFWRILFSPEGREWRTSTTPWLDWYLEFLTSKFKKAINKDLWRQTLTFAEETMRDDTLSFWNEESSWPSVIDEFVEWVKTEKRPGGGEAMDVE